METEINDKTTDSKEELKTAAKVLKEHNDKIIQECSNEINAVLQKHGCALNVSMELSANRGIVPNVEIVIVQAPSEE